MKKTLTISNTMASFLECYAMDNETTQSSLVETALTLYFQKHLGVMVSRNKNKPLKGQRSIYNIDKEVSL